MAASGVTPSATASYDRCRRWRSTGRATARTSSGVLKVAPQSQAWARAARSRAMAPRGLAPIWSQRPRSASQSAGWRVALTRSTMYSSTAGATCTAATSSRQENSVSCDRGAAARGALAEAAGWRSSASIATSSPAAG